MDPATPWTVQIRNTSQPGRYYNTLSFLYLSFIFFVFIKIRNSEYLSSSIMLSVDEIEQLQHERDLAIAKAGKMAKELADTKAKLNELEGRGPPKPSFLTSFSRRVSETDMLRLSRHKTQEPETNPMTANSNEKENAPLQTQHQLPPPVPITPTNGAEEEETTKESHEERMSRETEYELREALRKAEEERDAFKEALFKIRDDLAAEVALREYSRS